MKMLMVKVSRWLKIAISAALIYLLFSKTDLQGFRDALMRIDPLLFAMGFAYFLLAIFNRAHKWKILLRVQGIHLPLREVHKITYMSLFFNNFFLGSLGGDAFRAMKTSKHGDNKSSAFSSVVIDRFSGLVTLAMAVIVAAGGCLLFGSDLLEWRFALKVIAAGTLCLVVCYAALYILENLDRVGFLSRHPRLASVTRDFVDTIKVHRAYPRELWQILLLGFIYYLINALSVYYFALAGGVDVPFVDLLFATSLISFLVMVPISVNGIGVQESAFFFLFERLGVDPSSALLIALLPRICILLTSLIGAAFYIYDRAQASESRSPLKNIH